MPDIRLPDGSVKKFDRPVTVAEIAQSIGAGLARAALAGMVDGKLVDTSYRVESDAEIRIVTDKALDAFAAAEPALDGPFDLAFVDAIKTEYPAYLDALLPRLAPGALVVADNVLQDGRVALDAPDGAVDESVRAIRVFNRRVLTDRRFVATIIPVGDGMLAAALRT